MNTTVSGTPHTFTKRSTNASRANPALELASAIGKAVSLVDWLRVLNKILLLKFALPSKLVYEALQKMPVTFTGTERILRDELSQEFHDHLFSGFDGKNIGLYERKFITWVQAGSFTSPIHFLVAKNESRVAYKKAGVPMPVELVARIKACEGFIKTRGAGFTVADYEAAGYTGTRNATQCVLVHPSGDSVTMYDGVAHSSKNPAQKVVNGSVLTGGALMSSEERAERERANTAKREAEREARAKAAAERAKNDKSKAPKPESDKSKDKSGKRRGGRDKK